MASTGIDTGIDTGIEFESGFRVADPTAPERAAKEAHRSQLVGRGLALGALVLTAFSLRTAVTSLTPLLGSIGDDLGFGAGLAGVLGMVPTIMFSAAGLLTPMLVRRVGLQRVALLSMILATIGLAARALGGTASLLIFSAIALAGMGIGNVVVPPLVKRYFPDQVPLLSTVYILALQLGTMIPPLVAVPVAHAIDWRVSLAGWAVMSLLAVLPWVLIVRRTPNEPHTLEGSAPGETGNSSPTSLPVWRSPVALGLALMFSMTSLNTYAMFTWLPEILASAGHDEAFGGSMVALFSAVGLGSALTAPVLAARMRNPFPIVIVSVTSFLIGYLGLLLAPSGPAVLWVLLVGAGPTTFPLALTLINLRTRTHAGSASLSGFAQGTGYALASLGPLLFGMLHSSSGGWGLPFGFLFVTLVLLLIGGALVCRPRYVEDTVGGIRPDAAR